MACKVEFEFNDGVIRTVEASDESCANLKTLLRSKTLADKPFVYLDLDDGDFIAYPAIGVRSVRIDFGDAHTH